MPTFTTQCDNCACSSHQIIAAGGCPNRVEFRPEGRAMVPGQDVQPHEGKNLRLGALMAAIMLVLAAWGVAAAFSLAVSA